MSIDQPVPEIWQCKHLTKITLKVMVNDPIFDIIQEGSRIHIMCKNGDSSKNPWRFMARKSSNMRKLTRLSPKWPWRSRSIDPIFNSVREGPKKHIQCKFGNSSLNPCQVIVQTSIYLRTDRRTDRQTDGQTDGRTDRRTDRQTDGGNDNTLRQNLPRGKNWSVKVQNDLDQSQLRPYLKAALP